MKNQLWDSFNFSEASELFNELVEDNPSAYNSSDRLANTTTPKVFDDSKEADISAYKYDIIPDDPIVLDKGNFKESPQTDDSLSVGVEEIAGISDLERALQGMCKRGGFQGAVIADFDGLPIAVYNSPVNDEILAAYSTVLGESLEKATIFLNQPDANNISIDINILDKIVLRKFVLNDLSYYIMVIARQDIDERAEVELLINQVIKIL